MTVSAGEVDIHVGRRMKQRREALGMSQGRLGSQLGLTFSQVQKYEKGANRIGAGRLYLLARIFEVPVEYFFEGLRDHPMGGRPNGSARADLSVLDSAFLAIKDGETRESIIALVRSLGGDSDGLGHARPRPT